jgi:ribonuclease Z
MRKPSHDGVSLNIRDIPDWGEAGSGTNIAPMRPIFQPWLVNGPSGDPALYVDILFERRALLLDLGDLAALPPRKLLRTSHVFVSHTHMDHFVGFDRLLRVCLGRERPLTLYGPEGFIAQVEHKLAAFTWNLVENYAVDLAITACEVSADGRLRRARFNSSERFARCDDGEAPLDRGRLLVEPAFEVRCAVLDHKTPCLAFAVQEAMHVNVWRNRLEELGVAPGPWLHDVKRAILAGAPDDTEMAAPSSNAHGPPERRLTLGLLRERALRLVPGQKIAYVTDVAHHAENTRRIVGLAAQADLLYIECTFLAADAAEAGRKAHLTSRQAGTMAREAGARAMVPFHFSPRYSGREAELRAEAQAAFGGVVA